MHDVDEHHALHGDVSCFAWQGKERGGARRQELDKEARHQTEGIREATLKKSCLNF